MAQFTIGAAGVGLQPPQALYPVTVLNQPMVSATNALSLPAGGDILIPAGTWLVSPGIYSQVQILDPVTTQWLPWATPVSKEPMTVNSDGVNYRIANPTGFPIGAIVTISGSGYTSAPTVTPTPAGSLWTAVVGGGVSAIQCTAAGSGSGYATAPIVNIAAPPSPGVPATAIATINSSTGSIVSFTIVNQGAGYTSPPAVTIIPQASDQNANPPSGTSSTNVVNATAAAVTSFAGMLTAVLMTNEGNNSSANAPALAFSGGGGANAAATAIPAISIQSAVVSNFGSGYTIPPGIFLTTTGGSIVGQTSAQQAASAINPQLQVQTLIPRAATITTAQGSGSGVQIGIILDGGIFTAVPTVYAPGNSYGENAAYTPTMGGVTDTVFIQPL